MPDFAALFALLLVGHHVGDYLVQTDWMASLKVAGATWPAGHPAAGRPVPACLSWWWNQVHVATYTAAIAATVAGVAAVGGFAGQLGTVPVWYWLLAAAANWAAHALLDRRWPVVRLRAVQPQRRRRARRPDPSPADPARARRVLRPLRKDSTAMTDHDDRDRMFSWERDGDPRENLIPARDTGPGTPGGTPQAAPAGAGPGAPPGQETAPEAGEWAAPPRVLVDSPEAQRAPRVTVEGLRAAERRPIVPGWLRSREGLVGHLRWAAGLAAHYGAYHATRSPKYAGKLAGRAPVGASRALRGWVRWLLDLEGEPVRNAVVRREDAEQYRHLSRQRDRRVRWRAVVTAVLLVVLVIGGVGWWLAAAWARLLGLALAVGVLGTLGQPADRPLLDTAVVIPQRPRLTSDMVARALSVLGVPGITQAIAKEGFKAIDHVAPITRDGPGYRADIDLPLGVTVGDIVDKRARLASGLRRPLGCVWPEGDSSVHEGRLILWVGDKDLASSGPLRWKFARAGQHDVFTPVPFGADPRGRPVAVPLIQHNVLIGSLPGQGKTSAVRVLACGAALDPTDELWVHELKGSGDLDPLERVCHRYVSGIDDDSIRYAADSLTLLRAEVMRRTGALKKLPRDLCPDKRVTRQIADRRALGLHPLTCVIDECQNLFAHPDYGAKAGEDAEFVIKIGRAFGVTLVLATQRPDKDSLPTGVSGNVSIRFCLKVAGQVENDMILGTSAYKNGLRATVFRPEIDAGIGYLVGATSMPVVVRTAYLDGPATERIAARARALREAAGTLSGHALGEAPESAAVASVTLLADVLAVVAASEKKVWNQTAVARLAELRPEVYGGWKAETLTAALKPFGVSVDQVWGTDPATGEGANRQGFVRQHVVEAHANRTRRVVGGDAS